MLFHNWVAIYPLNWSFLDSLILQQLLTMKRAVTAEREEGKMRCSDESLADTELRRSLQAIEGTRFGEVISISRYALGGPRSPKHSIDPGSTHLSLEERAEGFYFREAVTCRGRYLALLFHTRRPIPFLSLPLRFPLALMSS